MTQRTKTDLGTQITTLLADNSAGDISASDVRSVFTDSKDSLIGGPASAAANQVPTFADTTGMLVQATALTVDTGGNIIVPNGKALQTDTTTAHTALLQAYDVDGTAYKTFATLTNANTPSLAIAAPAGGTVTIDGAAIGGSTPAAGAFTTLSTTGAITGGASSDIAINTNKFTVTASSGNTVIAGTLTGGSSSDIAINTNKFTVAASSGNTVVAGTLAVTGVTTHSTYILRDAANALTAAGTTRADAFQLAHEINRVTTAAASTGVILPAGQVGMRITLFNDGANTIKVYGSGSDTIDGVAAATGVSLTNAKRCEYICVAAATFISAQMGVVSA